MRHKPIVDVFTIIFKGFQRVGFELKECEKYFYLSPAQVKSNTNIDIHCILQLKSVPLLQLKSVPLRIT